MQLMSQVCTLEQAKVLRSLGVIQGISAFAFIKNTCHKEDCFFLRLVEGEGVSNSGYDNWESGCLRRYSAFTVAELGVMFGRGTNAASLLYDAVQNQMNRSHSFTIVLSPHFLANCLIGLLETGHITVDEVNERLRTA